MQNSEEEDELDEAAKDEGLIVHGEIKNEIQLKKKKRLNTIG